jgi:hypothetical protein
MDHAIIPIDYRVIERTATGKWCVIRPRPFMAPIPDPIDFSPYGLTVEKVLIRLFQLYAGKQGVYLINLKDQKYYYCGLTGADLKQKLLDIGFGRVDPFDE